MSSINYTLLAIIIVVIWFIGIPVYLGMLERTGCGVKYSEKPDYCITMEAASGVWPLAILYKLVAG